MNHATVSFWDHNSFAESTETFTDVQWWSHVSMHSNHRLGVKSLWWKGSRYNWNECEYVQYLFNYLINNFLSICNIIKILLTLMIVVPFHPLFQITNSLRMFAFLCFELFRLLSRNNEKWYSHQSFTWDHEDCSKRKSKSYIAPIRWMAR